VLQATVPRVAHSKSRFRFVLLSKQLRVLEELFRAQGIQVRLSAVSGIFTSQIQKIVSSSDPEFKETTHTAREVAVDWHRDSWDSAMWVTDFVRQKVDPLGVDDLSVDSLQYMVRGQDISSLGGKYQLLKLTFTTWSLKPGLFERLRTDGATMPSHWLYELFKHVKQDMKNAGQITPESEKRIRDTFLVLSEILPNQPDDLMTERRVMEELHPRDVALLLRDDEVSLSLRELRRY